MPQASIQQPWLEKYPSLHAYWYRPVVEKFSTHIDPLFLLPKSTFPVNSIPRLRDHVEAFQIAPWYVKWFPNQNGYYAMPEKEEFLFWHPIIDKLRKLPPVIRQEDALAIKSMREIIQSAMLAKPGFKLHKEAQQLATELQFAVNTALRGPCSYTEDLDPTPPSLWKKIRALFLPPVKSDLRVPLLTSINSDAPAETSAPSGRTATSPPATHAAQPAQRSTQRAAARRRIAKSGLYSPPRLPDVQPPPMPAQTALPIPAQTAKAAPPASEVRQAAPAAKPLRPSQNSAFSKPVTQTQRPAGTAPAAQAKPSQPTRTQPAAAKPATAQAPAARLPLPPNCKLSNAYKTLGFDYLEPDYSTVRVNFKKLITPYHPNNRRGLKELTQEDLRKRDAVNDAVQIIKEVMDAATLLDLSYPIQSKEAAFKAYCAKAQALFPGKQITQELALEPKFAPYAEAYRAIRASLEAQAPITPAPAAGTRSTASHRPVTPVATTVSSQPKPAQRTRTQQEEALLLAAVPAAQAVLAINGMESLDDAYNRAKTFTKKANEKELVDTCYYLLKYVNNPTTLEQTIITWAERIGRLAPKLVQGEAEAVEIRMRTARSKPAGGAGAPAPA